CARRGTVVAGDYW
nr:immunoglobulin heavy chain junction region [Mus musculus]